MKQSKDEIGKSGACENVRQYFLSSSLHGLRYIGTVTLSVFERVFFGISFLIVTFLATYFISNVYQKWEDSPVIIALDPVSTDIKDIPFPAVTICNFNQVRKSYAKSRKTLRDRLMLDSICTQGDGLSNETTTTDGTWSYVKEFLINSSQPCEEMIQFCKFGMQEFDCNQGFMSVLTDEGLCCTFNSVHPKLMFKGFDASEHVDDMDEEVEYATWTPEKGYERSDKTPYPFPVQGPGKKSFF